MEILANKLAPCGVYCGACPSFNKTCLGCPSENRKQKRKSKWYCTIRKCCYEEKNIKYCGYCTQFPCERINKKIIDSHPGETRFEYRHEVVDNMKNLKEQGEYKYLKYLKQKWSCPVCDGIIYFYHYRCSECGKEVLL